MKPRFPLCKWLSGSSLIAAVSLQSAHAASATWNGTTNASWATATNWSASPVPGAGDTATFNNAGNSNIVLDLGAGVTIGSILFNTATTAAYTFGTGAVNSQTLTLGNGGSITRNSTVTAADLFNASLLLGTDGSTQTFTITNSGTTGAMTFAGSITGSSGAGVKTLAVAATGGVVISGVISNGVGGGTVGLTKTGTGTLTLSNANSYSGPTTITGILNAGNSSALGTSAVTVNSGSGNQLQLGSGVNVGNALTLNGGGAVAQGVVYVPTGNATYSGTINVTAVANSGGTFATAGSANVLTIAGNNTITTAAAVPITVRNGTVVYTGSQSYTTGTTLANAGAMIQFGKLTSMPASGTVALSSGTTLAVNAGGAGEFTGGTGTGTIGGLLAGLGGQGAPVTLATGSSIGVDTTNATGTVTQSTAFTSANSVGLLKLGTGTLELGAGGTYGGGGYGGYPLIVRQGTLLLSGGTNTVNGEAVVGGTFGTATASAGYDAKLQIDAGALTISGANYLSVGRGNGIGGVSSDLVANNGATISAGNFSAGFNAAAGNLPKGTITLNNTSTFTITSGGVFNLGESTGSNMTMTLNNSAGLTTLGAGGKYIGNAGTGVLTLNNSSTASFGTGPTTGNGIGVMIGNTGGNGTLNLNGTSSASFAGLLYVGYNTGTGNLNMTGGTLNTTGELRVGGIDALAAVGSGSGTFSITGGTANIGGAMVLARGNDNADTVAGTGTISGTGTVNTSGDAILGYAGNNNLGKLTVGSGGTLNVGTGGLRWLILGQYDTSKGQLDVTGGDVKLLNGSFIRMSAGNGNGTNVVNQTGGNVTFYSDGGTTVGGSGALDLQQGSGTTANNTYNLNGGNLTVPQIISGQNGGTRTFNFNGGTLRPTASTAAFMSLGTGSARANVRNNGALIDTSGFDVTIGQALLHSNVGGDNAIDGGLTKSGGGTLTLNGVNTYTGTTTINTGKLALGAVGSIANSSIIDVKSGATLDTTAQSGWTLATGQTLKGNGTVDVGAANTLTIGGGAFLAPGASPGTIDVTGSLSFAASSTFTAELSPTTLENDKVNVAGALVISPTAALALTLFGSDTVLAYGTKFVLVDYGTAWDGISTFSGLADDSSTTFGMNTYLVDYNDPSQAGGTALTLTVIPEPAAALLGAVGVIFLLRRRRES